MDATFYILGDFGPLYRSHSSAFIAALVDKVNSKNLKKAADYFDLAAYKYAEINAKWNAIKRNYIPLDSENRTRVVTALRELADLTRTAGEYLLKGAKDLRRPCWPWWRDLLRWSLWCLPGAVIPAFIIYRKRKEE